MNSYKFRFLKKIFFLLIFYFSTVAAATEFSQQSGDFDYNYIFEQGSIWIDKDIITKKDPSSFISLEFIEEKQIETATFCPLVYTTTGGIGPRCKGQHKKVAQVISSKRRERYEDMISFIRTKTRFALLRRTLVALRGVRGPQKLCKGIPLSAISFVLVPEAPFCEG